MTASPFVLEEQSLLPVLIIDKPGHIGVALSQKLAANLKILLVSKRSFSHPRVSRIGYHRMLPKIPNSTFSGIIVVYHGESDLLTFLPELSEKATECHVPLVLLISTYDLSEGLYKKFQNLPHLQLIVYGDLAGIHHSRLSELVQEAKKMGKIILPHMGLSILYPTPGELLLEHTISLAFTPVSTPVYLPVCLFSKTPMTEISITRLIQHALPHTKIDFNKKKPMRPISWHPKESVFLSYSSSVLTEWIKNGETTLEKVSVVKHKKPHLMWSITGLVFLLLLSPLGLSLGTAWAGQHALQHAQKKVNEGKMQEAYQNSHKAISYFAFSNQAIGVYAPISVVVKKPYDSYRHMLEVAGKISDAFSHMSHAVVLMQSSIRTETANGNKDTFIEGINEAGEAVLTMQQLLVQSDLPEMIEQKLLPYQSSIHFFSQIRESIPAIVGFDGEKTYLVLFQNNTELRPGGGFIGSFALIHMSGGGMKKMEIYDVYDADGQLKGHVEPPFFLGRYMGAAHWYLRDSNASILFSENGEQALFFLDKELGIKADGVISVNATVMKDLLEKTGDIAIPEYKQTVTSENVIRLTQDKAEKDFFPGSTQKKDFLRAFEKSLEQKFVQEKHSLLSLVQLLGDSVTKKEIQYYFTDSQVQEVFRTAGAAGATAEIGERDIFGVNEANIGQNKVNQYLERRFDHQIKLEDTGDLAESVSVTYMNTSGKNSEYGGDYTSFLRFVLPRNASLVSLQVDGQIQPIVPAITDKSAYEKSNFLPPKELEVQTEFVGEMQTIGIPFVVPMRTTKKITISYTYKIAAPEKQFTYTKHLLKQSGTGNDAYTISMSFPESYLLKQTNLDNGQQIGSTLNAKGNLISDAVIELQFSK